MAQSFRVSLFVLTALLCGRVAGIAGATNQQPSDMSGETPAHVAQVLVQSHRAIVINAAKETVKQDVKEGAPTFAFPTGPSRALLFQLPAYQQAYTVTVTSLCKCFGLSKTIFVPTGVFLDADLRETHQLPEMEFGNKKPGMIKGFRVEAMFVVDDSRKDDRFLLLYTNAGAIGQNQATFVGGNAGGAVSVLVMDLLKKNGVKRSGAGTVEFQTTQNK